MKLVFITLVGLALCSPALCWDSVEMEVFDVVEEVNQNFYELMGISQDATLSDIKKAYRTLSKQIHPDKSDAPDAEIKFRQLVSVYEVLKEPERRGHYDRVLVEGLPDWRSAVYYYRRARKMSMLEITIILTFVISISQYLMAWGSYLDTWKTMDEALSRKYRSRGKQKKKAADGVLDPIQEALAQIPKPSWRNILPLQLGRGVCFLVLHSPRLIREWREHRKLLKEQEEQELIQQEETIRQQELEEEERRERKAAMKRRKKTVIPEAMPTRQRKGGASQHTAPTYIVEEPAAAGYNTGMWTHEEFCDLTKLMNKYPGGTVDRWEVIAEQLNRAPHEVTKMAVKMREKLAAGTWLQDQEEGVQAKIKTKTRSTVDSSGDATESSDAHWTAVQQRALERAIIAHPKGTDQRWEKIAKQVPEKTAENCINRFKFLAERIRKKKEKEEAEAKLATQREVEPEEGEEEEEEEEEERGSEEEAREESGDDDEESDQSSR